MQAEPEQVDAKLNRGRDLVDVLPAGPGRGEEGLAERILGDDHILRPHRATRRNRPASGAVTSIVGLLGRGTTSRDAWSSIGPPGTP